MKILTIKIKVKDNVESWKIVTHLGYEHEIIEANFGNKTHKFTKNYKSKDFNPDKK